LSHPTRWWTRNPLRVKLVAAAVVLVSLALIVISVGSTMFINRFLVSQADDRLQTFAHMLNDPQFQATLTPNSKILPPSESLIVFRGRDGAWGKTYDFTSLTEADLPDVLSPTNAFIAAHLNRPAFNMPGQDNQYQWRVVVTNIQGSPTILAQNLSSASKTVDRLVAAELLFGSSVLILLALVGAWLVRQSLRPLSAIERTAAGIAAGDLTQRVPDLDPRTELGQLSTALNTMLSQIESAFRDREESETRAVRSEERMRQFVADASHELRTPLTTIRGFAELYRQGAAPDAGEVLRRIENEAARMGLLVEDLLLLARLDRERPMQYAPVSVAAILRDSADAAHAVAPERTIELDTAAGESLVVAGDEARLRQVVGNLVTNALVHTPPGTEVALRLRPEDDQAVIEVADQGPGLTPEHAQHIFERFYRVDKARTRRAAAPDLGGLAQPHTGTGLGLAIVAALVAAHNGSVEVESQPGQGATFRVRIPLLGAAVQDPQLTGNFQR
jgi:two-component system OmpR family sensor kinase